MSAKPNGSKLETTVVGSYPAKIGTENIMNQFYFKKDPGADAIKYAVRRQLEAGINIISDGQVRKDMISIVASCCHGINTGPRPKIIGEIKRKCPIIKNDLEYIGTIADGKTKVKGILTGPYTLSRNCTNSYYNNADEVAWAFVDALKEEIQAIHDDVHMIQIDEPFLSVHYFEPISDMIRELTKGVRVPVALHVCGDVRQIFSSLLDLRIDIIDLEFVAHPYNLELLRQHRFKKTIGFGCVSVEDMAIETVSQIKDRIRKALDILPPSQLIIDPDCGLRNLTEDLAFQKLKNMVQARDEIRKEMQLT